MSNEMRLTDGDLRRISAERAKHHWPADEPEVPDSWQEAEDEEEQRRAAEDASEEEYRERMALEDAQAAEDEARREEEDEITRQEQAEDENLEPTPGEPTDAELIDTLFEGGAAGMTDTEREVFGLD